MKARFAFLLLACFLLSAAPASSPGAQSDEPPIQLTAASSKKPGVFQRMGNSTKKMYYSTKNALSLKKKNPAPKTTGGATNTFNARQAQQKKQGSWLSSLFRKEPERREPQTMKEWMLQDRPKF